MNWFRFLTKSAKGCLDSFESLTDVSPEGAMMHASERQQLQFGMFTDTSLGGN